MNILEKIKDRLDCKIAISGYHVSALTEKVMKENSFIDFLLVGEYEHTARDLVRHLIEGSPQIKKISGLAYRDKDGGIKYNGRRDLIKDLDSLPYPEREEADMGDYHDFDIVGTPNIEMQTSRGCPFNCSFCLERQVLYNSPDHRTRKAKEIVNEMQTVQEKHNAKQIYFDDQTIWGGDGEHLKKICEEILERGLDIPWAFMGDITIDYETLKLAREAGCVGLKFGVETITENVSQEEAKGFVKKERVKDFREDCRDLGLWTHATYMIGLPNDTEEKIKRTIEFARTLDTESLQFSIATPFPGTPLYEKASREGWIWTNDWTKYDGNNYSVLDYPHLSKEKIEELSEYAHFSKNFWNLLNDPTGYMRKLFSNPIDRLESIIEVLKNF